MFVYTLSINASSHSAFNLHDTGVGFIMFRLLFTCYSSSTYCSNINDKNTSGYNAISKGRAQVLI